MRTSCRALGGLCDDGVDVDYRHDDDDGRRRAVRDRNCQPNVDPARALGARGVSLLMLASGNQIATGARRGHGQGKVRSSRRGATRSVLRLRERCGVRRPCGGAPRPRMAVVVVSVGRPVRSAGRRAGGTLPEWTGVSAGDWGPGLEWGCGSLTGRKSASRTVSGVVANRHRTRLDRAARGGAALTCVSAPD